MLAPPNARRPLAALAWLWLLVGLAACSPGAGTPTPGPTPSVAVVAAATATLPPLATQAAPSATPTRNAPLGVETPTLSPTPTETATFTPEPPCTNDLTFLSDVTIPDGTHVQPGQFLDKQWSVRNAGTCDWGPEYRLVLVSGSALGPRSEVALYPAQGGTEAVLQIPMVAPLEPGSYTGRWQARDPEGNLFGNVIFIKIEVIGPPTEAPTEAPPP